MFWATPKGIKCKDPDVGWKKKLVVDYLIDGEKKRKRLPETKYDLHGKLSDTELLKNAEDGPENCVCLVSRQPRNNLETRYWLDPRKGYVVMQTSWFDTANGDRIESGSSETLELVETPSGRWVPSLIRKNAGSIRVNDQIRKALGEEGKRRIKNGRLMGDATFIRYFYDFESEVPDGWFDLD